MHFHDGLRTKREQIIALEVKKLEMRKQREYGSPHHKVIRDPDGGRPTASRR